MRAPLLLATLAFAALAFPACADTSDETPSTAVTPEDSEDELTSASKQGCGSKYTPALRKYELAVYAAKAIKAQKVCEPVTNPKDKSSTDATEEAVGELLQEAVGICASFRDVYKKSPYAAPARDVLADSLLGDVVSGALDTSTFATLGKALVGKTLFGPKPGVANLFDVTFAAGGKATFRSFDFDKGDFVSTEATWSVKDGAPPVLTIVLDGVTTTYTPKLENGHVILTPQGEGNPISTSSDPCSA